MSFRSAIPNFTLANSLYVGATVAFWGVDINGEKTNVLPLLYASPTGPQTVSNPQVLDGEGKFSFPVYHDVALISEVRDITGGSVSSGIIMPAASWGGPWTSNTIVQVNTFLKDPVNLSIYAAANSFITSGSIAGDILAGNLVLVFQGEAATVASNAAAAAIAAAADAAASAAAAASTVATLTYASQAEGKAGVLNNRIMSPEVVKVSAEFGDFTPPAGTGQVRSLAAKAKDAVSYLDFSSVNDTAKLKKAIEYGGTLVFPDGTINITARVNAVLSRDTAIIAGIGTNTVLDAGIGAQAFTITSPGKAHGFIVQGGRWDAGAVVNPGVGGDIGSIWDLNTLKFWGARGGRYFAGTNFSTLRGDTAFSTIDCGPGLVEGVYLEGWPDNAFYLSGGSLANDPSDDGEPTIIASCYFKLCSTGVALKRRNRNVRILGGVFDRCFIGAGCYEVGAGEKQPGEGLKIIGVDFLDCVLAAVELRGGRGRSDIIGCRITDFGYNLNGTVVSNPSAIQLLGSERCNVSNNTIEMDARAKTGGHVGILLANRTIDGTAYTAQNNFGTGNIFRELGYSVYEGPGVGPNKLLLGKADEGVTSNFLLTNANSEWSAAFTPSNFRWYRFSSLLQNF